MEEFTPAQTYTIPDLETLRTLSDPLRMQIYEIVLDTPSSVRQIAERLGLASSRLYYHINQLEKFGLIRMVETRMVANMMEKIYRAVAFELELAPGLLNFNVEENRETLTNMMVNHLDITRDDILRSLQARQLAVEQGAEQRPRTMMVNRLLATIPDEVADEFTRRLQALIKEFGEKDHTKGEKVQTYALTVAFYPTFYYPEQNKTE